MRKRLSYVPAQAAAELANLRTAFRWAADHGDLCRGSHRRHVRGVPRLSGRIYEPIAWAEEIIEPAWALEHPGSCDAKWPR